MSTGGAVSRPGAACEGGSLCSSPPAGGTSTSLSFIVTPGSPPPEVHSAEQVSPCDIRWPHVGHRRRSGLGCRAARRRRHPLRCVGGDDRSVVAAPARRKGAVVDEQVNARPRDHGRELFQELRWS
jgi:hypothetical protein